MSVALCVTPYLPEQGCGLRAAALGESAEARWRGAAESGTRGGLTAGKRRQNLTTGEPKMVNVLCKSTSF